MQIVTRNVAIANHISDPLGEQSHLIKMAVRHEGEQELGVMPEYIYLIYSKKHRSVGQITENYAAELALNTIMYDAETSVPKDLPKDS